MLGKAFVLQWTAENNDGDDAKQKNGKTKNTHKDTETDGQQQETSR